MVEAVNNHRNHSVKLDTHRFEQGVKSSVKHIPKKHQGQP